MGSREKEQQQGNTNGRTIDQSWGEVRRSSYIGHHCSNLIRQQAGRDSRRRRRVRGQSGTVKAEAM